jgi:hypothetical protein
MKSNLNSVDRLIVSTYAETISQGIDGMLIAAQKYPELMVRLTEITQILTEMVNYANDIEEPTLRPRNQNSTLN